MLRVVLLMLASLISAHVAAASSLAAPKVIKVSPRIYALLGPIGLPSPKNQGYMVNSTLILGDTGAILIDTGFSDEVGAHLGKAVAKLTKLPVKVIINTHHHGDHTLGNAAFPDAKVISTVMARELLVKTGPEWLQILESSVGRKFPNTRVVPATDVYANNARHDVVIDGVKMNFWAPDAAHTLGDMMIWLPDDQVLVAGDILVNQTTPNFRDGVVKRWVDTLAEVKTVPAKTIIPGHGPLMKPTDAAAMHARMAALYAGVEAGYKAGLTDSEIRKKLDLSAWKPLHEFDAHMGGNINKTYLEIEASNF